MDNFDLRKYLTENKLTSNSKLDEIGDASSEAYKWEALPKSEAGEGHSYSYKFTTDNGIEYEAEFWYSPLDGKKGKLLYLFEFAPSDAFDGGDDGNPLVTNEGTPLRVMSTIVQILKDFIDKNPTAAVQYSAGKNFSGDARRAKLYMAYVKKLLPSNYEVVEKGDDVLIQPKDSE